MLYVFQLICYHTVMNQVDLDPIKELYRLWKPIYPYLTRQISELIGRKDLAILEVGPFCGAIFSLQEEGVGSSFSIATFPPEMVGFFREEAKRIKADQSAVQVIESDDSLTGIEDSSIDLVLFRGALFFPSLFRVNFSAVHRVLREEGVALVGGGFGKYTPQSVIGAMGKRSRELNLLAGKVEVSEPEIRETIRSQGVAGNIEITSEGGLWVIMRKEP
jgi:hypothetical protein